MRPKDHGWLVLTLFFCSGATALVYEVIWSKFLSQMFGSTIYAQTVVLAAFMGGLAIGNRLFGKWADGLASPVSAYGYLEIVIGLYAFFFPALDKLADSIFISIGSRMVENTGALLALKGVLSGALLLGPTILMGGTLPLLAAWLQKSSLDAGRRSARFYSVNSLGAVAGSAIAGFWLVQNLGMVSGLQMTALFNVLVGAVAIVLTRGGFLETVAQPAAKTPTTEAAPSAGSLRWAGATVAVTGFVSMGLEVLASRSLSLIFGSSLQSFAIVLMAFILGIGLGSAIIASPRWQKRLDERMVVILLCAAALWVVLLVFNIERWADFYRLARTGIGRTSVGYIFDQLLSAGLSLVVLGIPAACIGAVLPLMIRTVSAQGAPLGAKVGALLTWNTLGAVAGALVTGFVIMPMCGLRNAFGVLALCLAIAALLTANRCGFRVGAGAAAACFALACALFVVGGHGWKHVFSSGVFRQREIEFDSQMMTRRKENVLILLYEDAPDATVTVEQNGTAPTSERGLRINGKSDASTGVDKSTQFLLAHLPMMARPGATDVFVLGLGSGMSAGALLSYPVKQVTVAENCAPVIRGAKFFEKWNHGVLTDPRVRIWREDARTVLKLRPQLYDIIITEPSNPWTAGVGSVFSREYYELAASRLKPGGIMAAWFHVYEIHDGIVDLVLRIFGRVFPYVEVWDTSSGDIVLIGSQQPWATGPEVFRPSFNLAGVREDMESIAIRSPEELFTRQIASQRTGNAIVAYDGPTQSDLYPVLEYAAPRAFFIGGWARSIERFDERTIQAAFSPATKRAVLTNIPATTVQGIFENFHSVNQEFDGSLRGQIIGLPGIWRPAPPDAQKVAATNAPPINPVAVALDAGDLKQAIQLAQAAAEKNPQDLQAAYVLRVVEMEWKLQQAAGAGRSKP